MLSEKIKEETKQNHQLLEKKLVAFMRAIRSKEDYVELLILFYSFFGGLEIAIDAQLDHSHLPDYKLRRKTAFLADDLVQFGRTPPDLAGADELPGIHNHLQALGALYVIEGSTLGGTIISKMIKQQLAISDNKGLSFFNGYREETEKMWQDFKLFLNRPLRPGGEAVVIQAANDTFNKFSQWFDKRPL
jgi:heme oxygenase (biliverdin-IX-beta and delta-forming)